MSNMDNIVYKQYLQHLGPFLKEYCFNAKSELTEHWEDKDKDYHQGMVLAWHRVISLMQQEAKAFGIPLEDIGLEGIDPDNELTGLPYRNEVN